MTHETIPLKFGMNAIYITHLDQYRHETQIDDYDEEEIF